MEGRNLTLAPDCEGAWSAAFTPQEHTAGANRTFLHNSPGGSAT
jgi:hypothetical protein